MTYNRKKVLGFEIDPLTMQQTINFIVDKIEKREQCQHVVLNAGKMVAAYRNEYLKNIINNCSIINADGQSVVWASKFLGRPLPERVAGIDLMNNLLQLSANKGYRVFLFGATETVVRKVVSHYQEKLPDLKIVGYINGYFAEQNNEDIIRKIKRSKADILFVGFSSPQKEYWLAENIDKIGIPFCMGVGGSFDIVAGITKRAPIWMQKLGLEWFYRLIQEPRRMWKRYLIGNIKFIYYVLMEKFFVH